MRTVTRTEMTHKEFDELVASYFPKADYSFVVDMETHVNTSHIFNGVDGDIDLEYYPELIKTLTGYSRQFSITRDLLDLFVYLKLLPGGDYLIEVA